jgi:hypothetical protein
VSAVMLGPRPGEAVSGVQRLDEAVFGCCVDLGFDPITKPIDRGTLVIDLGLFEIDLLVGERDEVMMGDMRHLIPFSCML